MTKVPAEKLQPDLSYDKEARSAALFLRGNPAPDQGRIGWTYRYISYQTNEEIIRLIGDMRDRIQALEVHVKEFGDLELRSTVEILKTANLQLTQKLRGAEDIAAYRKKRLSELEDAVAQDDRSILDPVRKAHRVPRQPAREASE